MIHPINHLPPVIKVGIQTESGVEAIGFDLSPWMTRWPGMTFAVWPTRPGESASYIAADTELVGNVLYWYPNGADTEKEGAGTVEVVGVGDGKCKTTGPIDTLVKRTSLNVTQDTPEPFKLWVDGVMQAADNILNKVDVGDGGLWLCRLKVADSARWLADRTYAELDAAVESGKTCILMDEADRLYLYNGKMKNRGEMQHVFLGEIEGAEQHGIDTRGSAQMRAFVHQDGQVEIVGQFFEATTPNKLTIEYKGETVEFDGSKAVNLPIDEGLFVVRIVNGKADKTVSNIRQAVEAGKTCILLNGGFVYTYCGYKPHATSGNYCPTFVGPIEDEAGKGLVYRWAQVYGINSYSVTPFVMQTPNPHKLILTGAVEVEYDGSEEIVVKIPEAGGTSNEITILRETDLTRVEDDGSYLFVLSTPWENDVVAGNSYKVSYNGVVYDLKATKASDLMPDAVPGMLVLGNYSIMGMEGGDAKAPFCLAAYPNAAGAEMGGYAALVSNDGAESVTLSVAGYASVAPAELPKITLTIDEDGNVTSDTPFETAWAMDTAHLQAAITVVSTGTLLGADATYRSPAEVRRVVAGGAFKALQIAFVDYLLIGDVPQMHETTRYIYWQNAGDKQLYLASHTISSLPSMDADHQTKTGTFYLRCVDGNWQAVGIDQLKADLGLGGGDTTTDVFYTADGQIFTDVNGAVMHIQKGDQ